MCKQRRIRHWGCVIYANPLAYKPAPLLHEEATVIPLIAPVTGVATHTEDDRILAIAVSGKAAFLVTGDTQLQKLGSFKGVTILSPADFLKTLYEQELGKGEAA